MGNKAFLSYQGQTLLQRAVNTVAPLCKRIIVSLANDDWQRGQEVRHQQLQFVAGGHSRHQSIANMLEQSAAQWLLIHDVVRPFSNRVLMRQVMEKAKLTGAATSAMKSAYPAVVGEDGRVDKMLNNRQFMLSQTPQVVSRDIMLDCYQRAYGDKREFNSIPELLHAYGVQFACVECAAENFKITTPVDWHLAQLLFAQEVKIETEAL